MSEKLYHKEKVLSALEQTIEKYLNPFDENGIRDFFDSSACPLCVELGSCDKCPYGIVDENGCVWIGCHRDMSYSKAQDAYIRHEEGICDKDELIEALKDRACFHTVMYNKLNAIPEVKFSRELRKLQRQ